MTWPLAARLKGQQIWQQRGQAARMAKRKAKEATKSPGLKLKASMKKKR